MMDVMQDREVWRLNLELLPGQPSRKSGKEEEIAESIKTKVFRLKSVLRIPVYRFRIIAQFLAKH